MPQRCRLAHAAPLPPNNVAVTGRPWRGGALCQQRDNIFGAMAPICAVRRNAATNRAGLLRTREVTSHPSKPRASWRHANLWRDLPVGSLVASKLLKRICQAQRPMGRHRKEAMATLDKQVALRIAMAARALPGIDLKALLSVLLERLGTPLDTNVLTKITVTDLKTGLGSLDGEEDGEDMSPGLENLKNAVQILWGDETAEELPLTQAALPLATQKLRVAVASNSSEKLNGHFGSCLRFLVYEVSETAIRLVDLRSAVTADLTDDKNAARATLISDCQVLYVVSMGGPAAAKVIRQGVYPIKQAEGGDAREHLQRLQGIMVSKPPPWLAKILGVAADQRTKFGRANAAEEMHSQ